MYYVLCHHQYFYQQQAQEICGFIGDLGKDHLHSGAALMQKHTLTFLKNSPAPFNSRDNVKNTFCTHSKVVAEGEDGTVLG